MNNISFLKSKTDRNEQRKQIFTSLKPFSTRIPWAVINKNIWIMCLVFLVYVILQLHPRSSTTNNILPARKTNLTKRVRLQHFVADNKFADKVQSVLGDDIVQKFTLGINQQMNQLCALKNADPVPIYIITPTYRRPEQEADLTRLAQTLMHLRNIYWLLCEDATKKSALILELLRKWRIRSVHLIGGPRTDSKRATGIVNCRNEALKWIRKNAQDGVLYFADDDNTYDLDLFKEMRNTRKVAMWPVGLSSKLGLSTPIVENGKFIGFYDGEAAIRTFPVDSAGFAVNVKFLKQRPDAKMSGDEGALEDSFLKSLAPFQPDEIELKADNCTEILAWHIESVDHAWATLITEEKFSDTNLFVLKHRLV